MENQYRVEPSWKDMFETERAANDRLQHRLSTEKAAREKAEQRAEAAEKALVGMADSWQRGERFDCQMEGHLHEFGYDYIHKSKLDAVLEALKDCVSDLKFYRQEMPSTIGEQSLTAAETVLKENQKENYEKTKS